MSVHEWQPWQWHKKRGSSELWHGFCNLMWTLILFCNWDAGESKSFFAICKFMYSINETHTCDVLLFTKHRSDHENTIYVVCNCNFYLQIVNPSFMIYFSASRQRLLSKSSPCAPVSFSLSSLSSKSCRRWSTAHHTTLCFLACSLKTISRAKSNGPSQSK